MSKEIKITKPIRLIELFAGYGSQAMALKRIGVEFENYKVVENDKFAIKSYNAIHETDFKVSDIKEIHAEDLNICDTDKYCYMLTYSFPCTDISCAGKQAGMMEGSETKSSLLWEVKRLLIEIKEDKYSELPQILFMENVTQIHNKKNINDFNKWIEFLASLGYKNYWQDLNAKDYGIPQNRNRCFMFSFLDDVIYKFPEPFILDKSVKDYLENNVDKKYYINTERANKLIEQLIEREQLKDVFSDNVSDGTLCKPNIKNIANTIKAGCRGIVNKQSEENVVVVSMNMKHIDKQINISPTLDTTHGYFGQGFTKKCGVIERKLKD